jgi:prepilin-type processing-associated H-X9-DG protein
MLWILLALQATPSDTVRSFVDAWNERQWAKACQLTVGGDPRNAATFPTTKNPSIVVSNLHEDVSGDTATVSLQISAVGATSGLNETEHLRKIDGKWLIVPTDYRTDASKIGVLAYILSHPTYFSGAQKASEKTLCLSNVKQLALGFILYINDYNDTFMKSGSNVVAKIHPYIKRDELWNCPTTRKRAYSVNSKLYGVDFTKISQPTQTIMVYEGSNFHLDFRHQGKAAVGFADGHAKMIDATQLKSLRWNP